MLLVGYEPDIDNTLWRYLGGEVFPSDESLLRLVRAVLTCGPQS